MGNVTSLEQYKDDKINKELDRRYDEFISLLNYFAYTQDIKNEVVTVEFNSPTNLKILDGRGIEIESELIDYNVEDAIISALITYSPRRIIIKNDAGYQTTKTIRDIFKERVSII